MEGYKTPVVGIGGITAENCSTVTEAGADGVSVITAITNAEDISAEAREIKVFTQKGLLNKKKS